MIRRSSGLAAPSSAVWCQGPASLCVCTQRSDLRGAGSTQAPEHSNLLSKHKLFWNNGVTSQYMVCWGVVHGLCQEDGCAWRFGGTAKLYCLLTQTLNKASSVQAEPQWSNQPVSKLRRPYRSPGWGWEELPWFLYLLYPFLPRTVVISLQKPSLHVSSHVVCPQSTLPEHLSFLGSQAGTEGSCGLG